MAAPDRRLSEDRAQPWEENEVRRFLEEQCGLDRARPTRGRAFTEHDELFVHLRGEIENGRLPTSLGFVHADAHADLGIQTPSFSFVLSEWLARPLNERRFPPTTGGHRLANWSWLLYALACGWIRNLTYVHHPAIDGDDIPIGLLGGDDPELEGRRLSEDFVWLRQLPREFMTDPIRRAYEYIAVRDEARIPFRRIRVDRFRAEGPFDRVYITRSPSYTPASADGLFDLIRTYIDER